MCVFVSVSNNKSCTNHIISAYYACVCLCVQQQKLYRPYYLCVLFVCLYVSLSKRVVLTARRVYYASVCMCVYHHELYFNMICVCLYVYPSTKVVLTIQFVRTMCLFVCLSMKKIFAGHALRMYYACICMCFNHHKL